MTDNLPDTPQEAKPAKERRISKRIAEAVRLIVTGECATQKAAAERVGITPGHLCEMLKKPHVQMFVARRSRETIANGTMRASARLLELLDAGSEHVSLDASKHVLGIAGIKPADAAVNVSIELRAGWIIDVAPAPGELEAQRRPMIDVTPRPRDRDPQPDPNPTFKPPNPWD
jgi:hypothetical protein